MLHNWKITLILLKQSFHNNAVIVRSSHLLFITNSAQQWKTFASKLKCVFSRNFLNTKSFSSGWLEPFECAYRKNSRSIGKTVQGVLCITIVNTMDRLLDPLIILGNLVSKLCLDKYSILAESLSHYLSTHAVLNRRCPAKSVCGVPEIRKRTQCVALHSFL